eukprot:283310-Chlamydomonas_euryale.AAC.10
MPEAAVCRRSDRRSKPAPLARARLRCAGGSCAPRLPCNACERNEDKPIRGRGGAGEVWARHYVYESPANPLSLPLHTSSFGWYNPREGSASVRTAEKVKGGSTLSGEDACAQASRLTNGGGEEGNELWGGRAELLRPREGSWTLAERDMDTQGRPLQEAPARRGRGSAAGSCAAR